MLSIHTHTHTHIHTLSFFFVATIYFFVKSVRPACFLSNLPLPTPIPLLFSLHLLPLRQPTHTLANPFQHSQDNAPHPHSPLLLLPQVSHFHPQPSTTSACVSGLGISLLTGHSSSIPSSLRIPEASCRLYSLHSFWTDSFHVS